MGTQVPLFDEPAPDSDDRLNAAQAKMRKAQMDPGRWRSHTDIPRAKTESMHRMSRRRLAILGQDLAPVTEERPKTRADCIDGPRPCPWVTCRHHLFLDVHSRTGAIKINFPSPEEGDVTAMPETCALDVAQRGGVTLEEIARLMNMTRENVRNIEVMMLPKIRTAVESRPELMEFAVGPPSSRRALKPEEVNAEDFAGEDLDE